MSRVAAIAAPPPAITISQWAEQRLYLSPEDSAEPGKYTSARAPYQRGIMDAFHEEDAEEVTVMSSAQVGKTLIFKAVIGYHIDVDPASILVVQPTVEMGETFSKDRLAPMIRDTPVLRGKVKDAKSRDTGNTIQKKNFPGGHVTMVGANAPAGLASRPIRIALCDEVDRYPTSAGTEGDPVNLARKRTITYRSRKRIGLFSTPTIKGKSRIERAWKRSDQRRYYVPCPHCNHSHVLKWENVSIIDDDPTTAKLFCPSCGGLIHDSHKPVMLEAGKWVKENPGSKLPGFHINELYSPWRTFAEVAADFYAAKGNPEEEKTWWNTSMGEPFEESGELADADELAKRRENYDADTLPSGALTVTFGGDLQKDRIEIEFVAWGAGEESWGIEPVVLSGNPAEAEIWKKLDELLLTARFKTEDGRMLRVAAGCIDSGGHHVQEVYEYCTPRASRNIWAIKGQFGPRPIWPKRQSKSKKYRGHVVRLIGVDTAKDTIYARWKVAEGKPGYCHFSAAYDENWFSQATVEKRITRVDKRGNEVRTWEKPSGARNEAFDCRVYAYAALHGLKIERRMVLARRAVEAINADQQPEPPAPVPKPEQRKPETLPPSQAPPPSGASRIKARRIAKSSYLKRR